MTFESNIKNFKNQLEELIGDGIKSQLSLAHDLGMTNADDEKRLKKIELPEFRSEYEQWYSLSMQVVKQILPDRLDDFIRQYKNEKRKEPTYLTYGVSDYMIGLSVKRGYETVVDGEAAFPKFLQQLNILKSAQLRLESSLFDMREVLQADFFDDELDAATELASKGFIRGAGALAGVVLERHLGNVCVNHNLRTRKKSPTINDYNQMLKEADVIDIPLWRSIQHLGDIRNLCDHNKEREPTKEEVKELILSVSKIAKTLF